MVRLGEPLLVGLDMGSTNIKAVVYEPDGATVALASVPSITHYPRPTWAYYDPHELWSLAQTVLREATAQLDDPRRIAGIAVASMGEAGVPLDDSGEPTAECIAWFDRRTIPQAERLRAVLGEDRIFATTGVSLQHIFSICKLMWIKEHQPDAFARAAHWLHVAEYIAFKLCGVGATDWSLASRSMTFDLHRREWDREILAAAGIPAEIMAPPVASGTKVGDVTPEAAAATGLPEGATVAAGGQDHVCGALAAGAVHHGQMLDSMGTAEALFLALDAPSRDPELGRQGYTQGAHVAAGSSYVFGGLYTSGASVDWAHRVVGKGHDLATLLDEAEATPAGSLGATFIPHLRLSNAPFPDSRARAAFVGLTTDVDRGTAMRAVLEGLAYEARLGLDPLVRIANLERMPPISVIGGSSKNELLLRIKASVMNTTHRIVDLHEATALGAAMLGGIGAEVYRDAAHALECVHAHPREVQPEPELVEFYERYYQEVFSHLYTALRPINHRIHALMSSDDESEATHA